MPADAEAMECIRVTLLIAPLQLGVGIKGGTEILVHTARLLLEANPTWACCSNDIRNGFNEVSRDAVLDALNADDRLRPLLPAVQRFYCREGGLFAGASELSGTVPEAVAHLLGDESETAVAAIAAAIADAPTDAVRNPHVRSTEGVRQGDAGYIAWPGSLCHRLPPCARQVAGGVP